MQSLNELIGELNLVAGDNINLDTDPGTGEITITSTAQGTAGGDITSVTAGAGLTGGGDTGSVTLSVAPAFRLPESCTDGQVAKFDTGTGLWECAADTGTTYSAGAGPGLGWHHLQRAVLRFGQRHLSRKE